MRLFKLATLALLALLLCSPLFAGTLTFKDYVTTYLNQPAFVTIDSVVAASGAAKATVVDFVTYAQRKNYESVVATGEVITKEALLAAWDKDHPQLTCRQTPFGPVCAPGGDKLVSELTVPEFEALLAKHCGK
jgi:hypothetical protein